MRVRPPKFVRSVASPPEPGLALSGMNSEPSTLAAFVALVAFVAFVAFVALPALVAVVALLAVVAESALVALPACVAFGMV